MKPPIEKQARKRSRQTEQKILRAAERLFARHGFSRTSVQDIAREAGVNSALIFYYFQSKQNLYSSIFEEKHRIFVERWNRILAVKGSARGKLERSCEFLVRHLFAHLNLSKIVMREIIGLGEKSGLPIRHYAEEIQRPLEEIFREGVAQGEFRPVDPLVFTTAFSGAMRAFLTRRLVTGESIDETLIVRGVLDIFLSGILVRSD